MATSESPAQASDPRPAIVVVCHDDDAHRDLAREIGTRYGTDYRCLFSRSADAFHDDLRRLREEGATVALAFAALQVVALVRHGDALTGAVLTAGYVALLATFLVMGVGTMVALRRPSAGP